MDMHEIMSIKDKLVGKHSIAILIEPKSIKKILEDTRRIIILSSPLAFPGYTYAQTISLEVLAEIMDVARKYEIPIISYHGHQATLDVVNAMIGTNLRANRGIYTPAEGDIAIAIKLKKRLEKSEDIKSVKKEDIEILLVQYVKLQQSYP